MNDLLSQLRYAPAETRRRQMNAAEQLITDIDPGQVYPEDFVVYRITGYRPDTSDEPTMLVGEALLEDIPIFIERLSQSLHLRADERSGRAMSLKDVADRLNVSTRTVNRYRRQGLVCHYITFENGSAQLGCFADALQRFTQAHHTDVTHAASYNRIDRDNRQAMIEQARELRQKMGMSLNQAASQIAGDHQRAHETVRNLLQQHEATSETPIFTERGPLSERERTVIDRAARRGVSTAQLARRFGRSRKSIHRVINEQRAQRIHSLALHHAHLATFDLEDASQVLLSPAAVRENVHDPMPAPTAGALLEQIRSLSQMDSTTEEQLLVAFNFLLFRVDQQRQQLITDPTAGVLDRCETDLRWADLLLRRLVMHAAGAGLTAIEQAIHRPMRELPRIEAAAFVVLAVEIGAEGVHQVDVTRGQRLGRIVGYITGRRVAQMSLESIHSRAAALDVEDTIEVIDTFERLTPWRRWLGPPLSWFQRCRHIEPQLAEVARLHFGWAGCQPLTCREIAKQKKTTASAVAAMIKRAEQQLRHAA